ncbi:alpha/beta hydrolase [Cellulomonas alba]|uniref:Alpha/beta fold hydrolase n=1 Tax=Cellulomonas alba TaxID=3053467 RepID=A0ABT7SBJ2_9CELL|nr:alpha/beta fold hydrolase [Cellulomonas alba]MDM7853558.1 alpha/beta fold hydrolase [Cellulomonas alba]
MTATPVPRSRVPISRAATRVAVRTTIRSLGAVAPPVAVRTAAALMMRVGRPAVIRPADRPVHERSVRGTLDVRSERVATYRWGDADAPTVLVAHGWQLRASRMAAVVAGLEAAGLTVVAFDAVAHGDSTGRTTNVLEVAEVLQRLADGVVARGAEVAGVVGHSLGGLAAGIALRDGLPSTRWVAINAPCSVASVETSFARNVALPPRLVPALDTAVVHRLFPDDPGASARAELVEHPAPPGVAALFVRDVDDTLGQPGDSRRLHAAHPGSDLLVTSGLGHNRVLDDAYVVRSVLRHVTAAPVHR